MSQRSSSIHLFVSKQAVNHRAGTSCLPVPLTSPLESLAAAECSGQPRAQALTRPASKLRQSLPRVELPQAAPAVHHGLCVQIRKAASWSKHTHKEKRKTHGQKEKKGRGGKCYHRYHLFEKWLSHLERERRCVWVCVGICLMGRCAACATVWLGLNGIFFFLCCSHFHLIWAHYLPQCDVLTCNHAVSWHVWLLQDVDIPTWIQPPPPIFPCFLCLYILWRSTLSISCPTKPEKLFKLKAT